MDCKRHAEARWRADRRDGAAREAQKELLALPPESRQQSPRSAWGFLQEWLFLKVTACGLSKHRVSHGHIGEHTAREGAPSVSVTATWSLVQRLVCALPLHRSSWSALPPIGLVSCFPPIFLSAGMGASMEVLEGPSGQCVAAPPSSGGADARQRSAR